MPEDHHEQNECVDIPMLIDSGADVTLLPQKIVYELDLFLDDSGYEIAGFDNNVTTAPVVQAELVFCGRKFRGQYLLLDQEWGILGRNVCNKVALLLDGPNHRWQEWQR